jgi:hypothetical protein
LTFQINQYILVLFFLMLSYAACLLNRRKLIGYMWVRVPPTAPESGYGVVVTRHPSKLKSSDRTRLPAPDECSSVVDQGTSMMVKDTEKATMDA